MDEKTFAARVNDAANLTVRTGKPHFLGFLTVNESAAANAVLKKLSVRFAFFGGYDAAERVMLGCFPDWCESADFPISPITFSYNRNFVLSHRDFLGALMSLGISRESVGDILVESGRAVVFLSSDICGYVKEQIKKVGSVGVEIAAGYTSELPGASCRQDMSVTVSSLRMDCVLAAVCSLSRTRAKEMIEDGTVSVNGIGVQKISNTVCQGDRLTVRGRGRFDIISCKDHSKKGKIILEYGKYI